MKQFYNGYNNYYTVQVLRSTCMYIHTISSTYKLKITLLPVEAPKIHTLDANLHTSMTTHCNKGCMHKEIMHTQT